GAVYRLHKAGFPVVVTELAHPLVVRRAVALATAVLEDQITVEGLEGRRVPDAAQALQMARSGQAVPVLVQPELDPLLQALPRRPTAIVDARMAKRNLDTTKDQAPLVVALGPGFTAGVDCDAVVETMRGHRLGRVLWEGAALPNTGTPGIVAGKGRERVLRAPRDGQVSWDVAIGDRVVADQPLGAVDGETVRAPFDGVVRGLIAPGASVRAGLKIGDVDARGDASACYLISDKALAIGGGVLEAILTHLNCRGGSS
ncbi:MAG TPA: selenium-dependent molybdenum cofactor biosynthesis protein YqeB, partial [Candidatus Sulfomarinibacteraceae bacterium]|nr:selenium-dependent molybdenum cofactor biosynthesis protein YqeB [Candidatus Sulfomarinibacteraceae bacterium]